MAAPTIARNYADIGKLVEAHKNSILEVDADGSIRAQTFKEKVGNLGLRITGKYSATKTEKDAKVAQAILNLFAKSGPSNLAYFDPRNNKDFARFFNPQPLQKRSATKELRGKPGLKLTTAINNQQGESLEVPAQKLFLKTLVQEFINLSNLPELRHDAQAFEGLASAYTVQATTAKEDNIESTLRQLKEDLKGVGLQLGKGRLEYFDISQGVVDWAQKNDPRGLERLTPN